MITLLIKITQTEYSRLPRPLNLVIKLQIARKSQRISHKKVIVIPKTNSYFPLKICSD